MPDTVVVSRYHHHHHDRQVTGGLGRGKKAGIDRVTDSDDPTMFHPPSFTA